MLHGKCAFRSNPPCKQAVTASQQLMRLVEAYPGGPKAFDPVADFQIRDLTHREKLNTVSRLRTKLANYCCVACPLLQQHVSFCLFVFSSPYLLACLPFSLSIWLSIHSYLHRKLFRICLLSPLGLWKLSGPRETIQSKTKLWSYFSSLLNLFIVTQSESQLKENIESERAWLCKAAHHARKTSSKIMMWAETSWCKLQPIRNPLNVDNFPKFHNKSLTSRQGSLGYGNGEWYLPTPVLSWGLDSTSYCVPVRSVGDYSTAAAAALLFAFPCSLFFVTVWFFSPCWRKCFCFMLCLNPYSRYEVQTRCYGCCLSAAVSGRSAEGANWRAASQAEVHAVFRESAAFAWVQTTHTGTNNSLWHLVLWFIPCACLCQLISTVLCWYYWESGQVMTREVRLASCLWSPQATPILVDESCLSIVCHFSSFKIRRFTLEKVYCLDSTQKISILLSGIDWLGCLKGWQIIWQRWKSTFRSLA